jgi:hypothetical protein
MPKALKVLSGVFIQFFRKGIEVCQAISDDRTALGIKPVWTIEIVHHTSANHRVQRHQGPFLMTVETRPAFDLVSFPERYNHMTRHPICSKYLTAISR